MWKRKFILGSETIFLAHKWNEDTTACGIKKGKWTYLDIEISKFPREKVCRICLLKALQKKLL